jgi:peptidoglycan L-alanyl-D-glutamate endopeptidase CwlK
MGTFHLNDKSIAKLKGVHQDLVKVVHLAISLSEVEFIVTEGLRTAERQATLMKKGASKTMHSRHIPDSTGVGHALDVAAVVHGKISWEMKYYKKIAEAMQAAAKQLNVTVESGVNWTMFQDGPHHQLPWKLYPNK